MGKVDYSSLAAATCRRYCLMFKTCKSPVLCCVGATLRGLVTLRFFLGIVSIVWCGFVVERVRLTFSAWELFTVTGLTFVAETTLASFHI
jgi:hypothetical protein